MAKEKSAEKESKKDRKEKRSEKNGVHKPSKKDKKDKKSSAAAVDTEVLVAHLDNTDAVTVSAAPSVLAAVPLGAFVPFANPLADDKVGKKVLKSVKKAAKAKTLKRGVKEVVKALRKSAVATSATVPHGIVVLAADISPMDVISHIPVLCEDHGVPYVFVTSRAELGAAGATKRPTSVVMVSQEGGAKGKKDEADGEWDETYTEMVKVVRKAGRDVRI